MGEQKGGKERQEELWSHKGSISLAPEERTGNQADLSALRQMGFTASSNSRQFKQEIIH